MYFSEYFRADLFVLNSSHNNFVAILDLPEGEHQYKFFVDGQWTHDPSEVLFSLILCIYSLRHWKMRNWLVFLPIGGLFREKVLVKNRN